MPADNEVSADPAPAGQPLPITAGQLRQLLESMPADKPLLVGIPEDSGDELLVTGLGVDEVNWGRGAGAEVENRYLVLNTVPAPEWLSHVSRRHEKIPTAPDTTTAPVTTEDDRNLPPFTEASRARITLASLMAELADRAAAFVPIYGGSLRPDGSAPSGAGTIEEVAGLVSQARQLLEYAVVTARLGGATWAEVGNVLDVTLQSAQERFGGDVARFHDELLSPENPHYTGEFGEIRYRLEPAALDPAAAAAHLDDWVRRHQAAWGEIPDPAPVSAGLARMDPHTELRWISDLSHDRWKKAETSGTGVPTLTDQLALAERTLACWEQIAAGQQRATRAVRDGLTIARRNLAALHEQAANVPAEQHENADLVDDSPGRISR